MCAKFHWLIDSGQDNVTHGQENPIIVFYFSVLLQWRCYTSDTIHPIYLFQCCSSCMQ